MVRGLFHGVAASAVMLAFLAGCSTTAPEADSMTTATELGVFGPRGRAVDGQGVDGGGVYIDPDGNIVGGGAIGGGAIANGGGVFGDGGLHVGDGGELFVGPDGVIREYGADGQVVSDGLGLGLGAYDTAFGSMDPGYRSDPDVQAFIAAAGDRVMFATDSSSLTSEGRETLKRQAGWLRSNPQFGARVEGHCDERGTREYNLALGARRAESVRSYLISLGVEPGRLETVSFGKERPEAICSSESCWSQNRRGVTAIARLR